MMRRHLDASEWRSIAASLALNSSVRASHCGTSTSAVISRQPGRISIHCFKCGENRWEPNIATLKEIAHPPVSTSLVSDLRLPKDLSYNLSAPALHWLSKYGVSRDTAGSLHFATSAITQRLYMPVLKDGSWIAYQARSLNGQRPKYLNSTGIAQIGSVFIGGIHASNFVVIVEDIISALRVGRLYNALSTLGTQLNLEKLSTCLKVFGRKTFVLWLDGDGAGVSGRRKMRRTLELHGLEVRTISTPKDPKEYTDAEVAQFVSKAMEMPIKC